MHTAEEKHQFTLLRVQGWSIAKIAAHLKIPKATIWRWDYDDREIMPLLKAARFEELQEKYVPTYEEELQQLTAYRDRIRKALGNQDLSSMKPEFLLQMDLQISARLTRFRTNLAMHQLPEVKPVSLPGCLSHTEVPYRGVEPDDDPRVEGEAVHAHDDTTSVAEPSGASSRNGTFRDKTPPGSKRDDSPSATYNHQNGTVPFSEILESLKAAAKERMDATAPAAEVAAARRAQSGTAASSSVKAGSSSQNGTFRDESPPRSKRDDSSSATYNHKNGTVPFSEATESLKAAAKESMTTAAPPVHPAAKPAPAATATSNAAIKAHSGNGTFRDKTPPRSKRDASPSTTYNQENGTVPFSSNGKCKESASPPAQTSPTTDNSETCTAQTLAIHETPRLTTLKLQN